MAISGGQRGSRARQPVVVVRGVILVASLAVAVMLLGASPAAAKPVTLVDDGGPDDVQGPKDLNELTVDAPAGSNLEVAWNWDAVSVSGVVTGDACALFDTNNDGNANRSLCVIWDGDARYVTTRLYSCGDTAADRCLQDRRLLAQDNNGDGDLADPGEAVQGGPYASRCSLGTVPDTFGPRPDEGANTDVDTRATCSIAVGDLGSTSAFLTNVCSYQTDVPSSPPVDCVVRPDSGFLNIVKVATPNDPATFAFDLGAGQQANDGRTSFTINGSGSVHLIGFAPGTSYDLTEVVPAGWLLESASCVRSDGTATGTISGDTVTDFQIQTGRLTTCTFTNSGLADLTLVKRVVSDNGGTAMASDWTLTADGAGDNDLTGQGPTVSGTVRAGAFTLSESGPGGYDASGWSCAGGALAGDQLTLAAGDDVTCTITNDDVQPTLTVTKTVVNDHGGTAGVADFPLFVGATPVVSGVPIGLDAGSYTVSETGVAGYAASEWGGDCAPDGSITLTLGDVAECTITNDDVQPTLTVVKTVVNDDGGTAGVADFPLFVGGVPVESGVATGVDAGSYTVSETEVAGYAASQWGGDCAPDGSITLAPGDDKTCTITNDDIAPTLTLVKRVVSDNGGTAMASDWTLTADGAGDNDLTGQGPTVSGTVRAGAFTLSESGPGGYDASGWSCAGGALAGDQLTLAAGDDVTCTITNDDVQPTLTVTKTVVNDDGGTAGVADFPLFVGATPVVSGVPIGLGAGGYTVSETEVAGYAASEWGGDCAPDGSITLTPGDDKTCTITNDDIAATLTVIKTVVNDDGGTLDVADFPLFVDATSVVSGVPIGLGAGSYTVSETEVAGYAASEWGGDCAPDGSVTLAPADDKTCTITNDDIAPTLTLVKDVDNGANPGGTAVADDWTLAATAGSPDDGRNFLNAGGSGTPQAVFANAGYDLAEDGPSGYRVSDDWSCDGGALSNATVTLGLGEHVTCTIANEALGMVELRKLTNGVENQAMMWNFSLTGPGVDERDSSPPTTVDFGGAKLAPGEEYTLCETDIPVGRTLEWRVDTDGDGVPDTIIPAVTGVNDDPVDPATGYSRVYDPHAGDPTVTTGTRCVNFVVDVGETLVFEIDNRQPVGQRRTIGYWKNWNTCTGGNQAQTAAKNGGPAAGWFILDDLLAAPGATIGVLQLDGDDCAVAVDILDRRSIDDGKKRASDGAYKLASHLLAARLNLAMGVTTCPEVVDAINAAQRLLADIGFNGTGSYQKSAQANAEALADLLDAYNNGDVCG